jgi:hypothetical protein
MTKTYVNVATVSATADGGELSLEELEAVNGGNEGIKFLLGYLGGKVLDAAWDALQSAGPAPATEHGSIYTVQPAGFVG